MAEHVSVINVQEILLENDNIENAREANVSTKASYWNMLHIFSILSASILTTSMITLIPRHNSIIYQEYWFETVVILVLFFSTTTTVSCVMDVFIYMGLESFPSVKVALKHYMRTMLAFVVPYGTFYFLWTYILNFNHPMPFLGYGALISWIISLPLVWFLIPPHLRKIKERRKQIMMYILLQLVWILISIQKVGLTILFESLSAELQILMAAIIPLCRSFDLWIVSKLVVKMSGTDNELANTLYSVSMNLEFAVFVAVMLADANDLTVYCMLGAEFALHLVSCYQIIKRLKKNRVDNVENEAIKMEDDREIDEVILSEVVEALVPLAYAASFATAYYGPNAKMIGNVRAQYWAYKVVEDIEPLYNAMMLLFTADMFCVAATVVSFWTFGRINLVQRFLRVMKKYWWLLMIKLSFSGTGFATMFAQNDINNGCDFTFGFEWISEEGRLNLIQNATDLTNDEKYHLLN